MKILVTYVPAGAGHQRAAEAIAVALQSIDPAQKVTLLDALAGADGNYRWTFTSGYLGMIKKAPGIWGALYYLTDWTTLSWFFKWLHRINNAWHARKLEEIFLQEEPDVVIGTHFMPMEVASHLKRTGLLSARIITVITDYMPHTFWIAPGIDDYLVGSTDCRAELIQRGVSSERIHLLGIPVDPVFSRRLDKQVVTNGLGLVPGRWGILLASGGFGTGPVARLVAALGTLTEPIQLMVVTGRNEALFESLEEMRSGYPHPMKVYGFVNNMHELMGAADVMITKPGGLSCAEGFLQGVALVLVDPIPGQESRNARILQKMNAAVCAESVGSIPGIVKDLLGNPEKRQQMIAAGRENSFPDAAMRVAHLALEKPP